MKLFEILRTLLSKNKYQNYYSKYRLRTFEQDPPSTNY